VLLLEDLVIVLSACSGGTNVHYINSFIKSK